MPASPELGAPPAPVIALRCHRCSQYIGEAAEPMELVAIVKEPEILALVKPPRSTWRCRCGWYNVLKPLARLNER